MAIHRNRQNVAVARLARFCKNIHRASEHPGYDVTLNGEKDCLMRAISSKHPLILDVGANVGDWTAMCQSLFPQATVHAFEINPKTARQLRERFQDQSAIHIHSFGLSSETGEIDIFAYEGEASVLSGMRVALHNHVPHTVQKVTVKTGDEFCEERKIKEIDYLKIDAEGADYEVLLGFKGMLARNEIRAIQFEHEGGRYLKDFYNLLTPFGYVIGKLYSNYIDFRPHEAEMEHFLGPNYFALRKNLPSVQDTLKKGW
jgi:FkbM family methyltransferase